MSSPAEQILDQYLPRFQWSSKHRLTSDATIQRCYTALVESPLHPGWAGWLVRLRGMNPGGSLREFFAGNGFRILEERPPFYLLVGLICQPWRPSGGRAIPPADWTQEGVPGYAKVVAVFGTAAVNNRTEMITETRILVQSWGARIKFSLYWGLIGPFSAILRRSWLHSARRMAER